MIDRRELLRTGFGAAATLFLAGTTRAEDHAEESDPAKAVAGFVEFANKIPTTVVNIATDLDLIQGPYGNVAVLQGPDGLVVVDSGIPQRGKEIFETAKRVGGKPVSTLINTHWHFDHAGGNEVFGTGGAKIIATAATRNRLANEQYTEIFKMTSPASPPIALPTLTVDKAEVHVGKETLELISVPPAHTDGDLIIHFKSHDLIHTGDLFSNGIYPNIDASSLGWIGGMIAAADQILKLAGPKTKIIPGHGLLATPADLVAFRKMLVTLYDRLSPMLDAGKTIEQAVAAKPTKDLDPTWGKGFFNGGMFTTVAYDGLIKHRARGGK